MNPQRAFHHGTLASQRKETSLRLSRERGGLDDSSFVYLFLLFQTGFLNCAALLASNSRDLLASVSPRLALKMCTNGL